MNKIALFAGAVVGILIFLYAALSALVNQGLTIWGAIVMLIVILAGGTALLLAVRK